MLIDYLFFSLPCSFEGKSVGQKVVMDNNIITKETKEFYYKKQPISQPFFHPNTSHLSLLFLLPSHTFSSKPLPVASTWIPFYFVLFFFCLCSTSFTKQQTQWTE